VKVFKFKPPPRPKEVDLNRLRPVAEEEGLTGYVHGKRASRGEELFARALDKQELDYVFSYLIYTPYQIPGQSNQIDFIVTVGERYPLEIDDEWIHKSAERRARDKMRDAILNEELEGWQPIERIPWTTEYTQEDADRIVGELFP